ncbi:MAG: cation-translocating P-type ATPase [Parachlamydia sp.]|nr:cation-translocating P-type ATPase [Parachlamydia sp.]
MTTTVKTTVALCALCSHDLPVQPILDGELGFCCAGCHAVYKILDAKNQIDNFQDHPVFKQALQSGLISNPHLLEQLRLSKGEQMGTEWEKLHLEIGEMWCPSCAEVIRLVLMQERGVRNCLVDYATDLASIEFAPRLISKETLLQKIADMGYRPTFLQDGGQKAVSRELTLRFIIAAFCALNVMMFAYPLYATYFHVDDEGVGAFFAWVSCAISLPVVTYSAWPILQRFWNGLKVGIWGMEALVVLGVVSAFGLSLAELLMGGTRVYFDSMTVVVAFVLLGRMIESKAKFSAKETLFRLARALPRRGRKRFDDGSMAFVSIKEIHPGDILIAMAGEKLVLDGLVVEGQGSCNESLMTGEALPVEKKIGSRLLGGTILLHGWLAYRVATTPEESALQSIIASVEQEIGVKSQYVRLADRIVRWFVPLVLVAALATVMGTLLFEMSLQTAILRAVAVLLISCPCAIGIAAPLAEAHLMNRLANLGVIVRNRGALQHLGKEDLFAFDKTGTVTHGKFALLDGLEKLSSRQMALLKALTARSNHPMAVAVFGAIQEAPIPLDSSEEVIGKGLCGRSHSDSILLGSDTFLKEKGIVVPEKERSQASTLLFAHNGHLVAELSLGDTVRKGIPELLQRLFPTSCVLLSGDGEAPVAAIATQCGFRAWHSRATPLQKREYLQEEREKGKIVCMVGDGINDAPALTSAHIGISVVSAADISIHVSDFLLTTDRLEILPVMRQLGQRGRRIIRQNLFWAFFYNVMGIPLAAMGMLSPLFAAGAMVASSLIVTLNAERLKR